MPDKNSDDGMHLRTREEEELEKLADIAGKVRHISTGDEMNHEKHEQLAGGTYQEKLVATVTFWPPCRTCKYAGGDTQRLTSRRLKTFQEVGNVDVIEINQQQLTEDMLDFVSRCLNVKEVRLDHTNLEDKDLKYFEKLTQLRELHIDQTKVTRAGIEALEKKIPNCVIFVSQETWKSIKEDSRVDC